MAEALPTRRWRIVAAVLGGVVAALCALVVAFDWNWLRGPLQRHLTERSGREVRIGSLEVELDTLLEPTVRLRDVFVQNAAWASKEPLIDAREISFRFALSSLWGEHVEVSHLGLVGAKVDMERLADGHRNWRLRKPDDVGPGTVRVMVLEAHDSHVHFMNRAIDLDLSAGAEPLTKPDADAAEYGLTTRVAYRGTYEGHAFSGEVATPSAISFRGGGRTFAARGYLESRGARVDFDGFFTDLFDLGPTDAKLRVTGPSLSLLYPFVRVKAPPSKRFAVDTQLTQAGGVYRFAQLAATIGSTALAGEATYDRSGERPALTATVRTEDAKLGDVAPLMGMRETGSAKNDGSDHPFHLDGLRALDANVHVSARRFDVESLPPLEHVRVRVRLERGVLDLKSVELSLAGGRVAGSASFDARQDTPAARIEAAMRDIDIERALPELSAKRRVTGAIGAHVKLASGGGSSAALLQNLTGTFEARLDRGRISNLSDAKLGLEFGKMAAIFFRGEREIAVACAAAAFDVRAGIARSRRITFESEQTRVDGGGTVDLKNETLDLVLTPEAKHPGLFTRRASLRVRGALGHPEVSIIEQVAQPHAPCAS